MEEDEMEQAKKTIAGKLAEVAGEVGYTQKDKRNQAQGYNYVSAEAVLRKVNTALSARGIAVETRVFLLSAPDATKETKNGRASIAVVKVELRLSCGDGVLIIEGLGRGDDHGDKAIAKAQTAAIKYAWMMALSIATGEDPEADESTDEDARPAPQKRERVKKEEPPPKAQPVELDAETAKAMIESLGAATDFVACRAWWVRWQAKIKQLPDASRAEMREMFAARCRGNGLDPNAVARGEQQGVGA